MAVTGRCEQVQWRWRALLRMCDDGKAMTDNGIRWNAVGFAGVNLVLIL